MHDECLPFEPRLHLGEWLKESCFLDLIVCKCNNDFSYITKQYFAANGDRLDSQITKSLHEFHFNNTFHDQNLYIFAFKMLLIRSSDMSNFAVTP